VVWPARQLALWFKTFFTLCSFLTVLCKQIQCTVSTRFWSKSQVSKFSRYSRLQGFTFEILEKLETWNCLHKTVSAVSHNSKRWCDLRANLHYGLKHFSPCARSWPSCANKYSAPFRPDFDRNLKFPSFQGIQGFKASPLKSLKNLKLGIVCTRRSCKRLLFQTVVWPARQLALWIKQFKYLLTSLTVLCKQMQCTLSTRFRSKSQVSKFSRYSRLQGFSWKPSDRNNIHRSHFGSRYKLGCCGHAGLFRYRFDSWRACKTLSRC
jgi:hypothetical protein